MGAPMKPFRNRRGFTLVEVILAISLLAILTVKVVGVLSVATDSSERDMAEANLDSQARRVLRQIGFAVMGSHPASLDPDRERPFTSTSMQYQVSLGIADGKVVWSDREEVAMEQEDRKIYWSDNPGAEDQRRVVWTSLVAPYLEGELPNGMDDNGNGLIDETGLSFFVDGSSVYMYLTLESTDDDGSIVSRTVDTVVTCRNMVGDWQQQP